MEKKIIYTLTEHKSLIGYGTVNDKTILITTDCDGDPKRKDKLIYMKLLDFNLYKYIIRTIFRANEVADIIYITRSNIEDNNDIDSILYMTREEFNIIADFIDITKYGK